MAAGVLIGRYYVPDDRQLRRTARHSKAYMRALSHLVGRDHETAISELRTVVEENIDDSEPYFVLGAMFRSRGEHERAIRVHQSLAVRERDKRKLRQRAWYFSRCYAHPTDADQVYVLNVQFHHSKDGGRTFRNVRVPHGDNHDLWIDPNDPLRMIESNDGGGRPHRPLLRAR